MVLANGTRIQNFKVDKFLGKGSYGVVYKVTRQDDNLPYAMKQINTRSMSRQERQEAVNEIRILASVEHTNVIRFCEAFVLDDQLYIITEFANHGDLFQKLQRCKKKGQRLPEDLVWSCFIQLCLGVQSLHRNKILHRDLKSANVFLASKNTVKVGDLGVAKLLKTHAKYAKTQIGTPYYVSPELWKNKPYNDKSDVWAMGCLLYEMAELKPPFDGANMKGLARKVMKGSYHPISQSFSTDLQQLISKLLTVDPHRRPTVDQILRMDCIVTRMSTLPSTDSAVPSTARSDASQMVGTIRVPYKMRDLTKELPSPRYQSAAPTVISSAAAPAPSADPSALPSIHEPRPPMDARGDERRHERATPVGRVAHPPRGDRRGGDGRVPRRARGADGEPRLSNVEGARERDSSVANVRRSAREQANGYQPARHNAVPPSPYTPSSKSYGAHYLAHARHNTERSRRQQDASSYAVRKSHAVDNLPSIAQRQDYGPRGGSRAHVPRAVPQKAQGGGQHYYPRQLGHYYQAQAHNAARGAPSVASSYAGGGGVRASYPEAPSWR